MAGDWIKMRTDLVDDPAVISIADELQLERDLVVGKLHRLWAWATGQLRDGNAAGVTEKFIDAHLCAPGFARALANVRPNPWLVIKKSGVVFPRWETHLSQGAKQRALTNRRVSQMRLRECNDGSVTKSLPEKRREEYKRNPPNPPSADGRGEPPPKRRTRRQEKREAEQREAAIWREKRLKEQANGDNGVQ